MIDLVIVLGYLALSLFLLSLWACWIAGLGVFLFLFWFFKVIIRAIISLCSGTCKLNFYSKKGKKICGEMEKMQRKFKKLDNKNQTPRVIKKKGKIIDNLHSKTERFRLIETKMEGEMNYGKK